MLLVVAAMLISAFAPQDLALLSVYNKVPGETVNIKMAGIRYGVGYYLTAPGPTHLVGVRTPTSSPWIMKSYFDIYKDIYDVTIYFCQSSRSGTINMVHAVRLVFPSCYGTPGVPNAGEPSNEKVSVYSSIPGTCNDAAAGDPGDGRYPWGCGETPAGFKTDGDQIWWRLDWFNWWNGGNDFFEPFNP